MSSLKEVVSKFPNSPGVYVMRDAEKSVIYVGKATSLKERVRSYFNNDISGKTKKQMLEVSSIEYIQTDSSLEALILESSLIKKYSPKYNIKAKDDKSRIYVFISKEDFPKVELVRENDLQKLSKPLALYGPFWSSRSLLNALELIRKIVPFRSCKRMPKTPCLYGHLGLCSQPCFGQISPEEYKSSVRRLRDFFEGKKNRVLSGLKKDLSIYSKKMEYEKAAKIRDQIYALEHLRQMFVISRDEKPTVFSRIEGYDISNVSGKFAVGSMVVFVNGVSEKSEYRKFKIKSVLGSDDVAMMREIIERRFNRKHISGESAWAQPDLIIIDGGRGQVGAVSAVLQSKKINIPIIGLAKGPDRKKDEIITSKILPRADIQLFKQVRDESHRFAKGYYKYLHRKSLKDR